jgi:SAM-dependent methyltransferase
MSRTTDAITAELEKFYHLHLQQQEVNAQRVGWKNKADQQVRFEQLTKVITPSTTGSINDLGCGLGDFAQYLQENGFARLTYVGYDIMEQMVRRAIVLNQQSPQCRFIGIRQAADMLDADYTVASGVFNVRLGVSDESWLNHVLEIILQMDLKSRKGFAFNALSNYSKPALRNADLYYADPLFLFDYCKRRFSENVALLHDYDQEDFTILVRKP